MRKNILSGSKWEDIIGYSRAVRIGNTIEVSGTVASGDNGVVGRGNVYEQTKFALEKIGKAIQEAGGDFKDIVRTRMFVTDMTKWEEAARAHGEFFKDIKPVTTIVEVKALIDSDYLIEIEATAIVA